MNLTEFNRLGLQYLPEMEAFALRLTKSKEGAKDLLQEAAYWAYKNRHQFTPGTNFRAWALTIIRNTFLSEYRQHKRRSQLLTEKPIHQNWSTREVTYNLAEGRLGAEEIMVLINALPLQFRHPFLLHFEGLKYKEIANRMGIPVGTAKSRVFTARQLLKEKLTNLYQPQKVA